MLERAIRVVVLVVPHGDRGKQGKQPQALYGWLKEEGVVKTMEGRRQCKRQDSNKDQSQSRFLSPQWTVVKK